MEELFKKFIDVPNEFRPVPFWSWNDDLDPEEIRRQIREMKKAGYGGYFMHARIGLITPYMGEKWMEIIRTAIDEGNSNEMDSWLYDEDKWPSGFAGGIIPKESADYRFKYLVCSTSQQVDQILKMQLHSQISQVREDSFILHQFTKENMVFETTINDSTYHFYEWIAPLGDKWYNDTCYVDLMNPDTVKAFIKSTYDKYYDECGGSFRKGVPGIFTDEPNFYSHTSKLPFKTVPWTKNFAQIFKKRKGYDIIPELVKLFLDHENYKKIRYDFYDTIQNLFVESFSKQIYEWCGEHNIIFTGHYLSEDNFVDQIIAMSKVMPNYEYQTYPGIDMLSDNVGQIGTLLTIKQVTSVAEQLGKARVLSETFGAGGWNYSLSGQKLMAEVQIALGINLMNPHLALYSMKGQRKRDYPPSLFYQQPYWQDYFRLNDYLSKLCYILSQGERQVNILLIHPIESAWLEFNPNDKTKVAKMDTEFADLINVLIGSQKDFHLGDETIMAKYGKVENGKLCVGKYSYDYVILPNLRTMRGSTYSLLKSYSECGGNIISINDFPGMLDASTPLIPAVKFSKYTKEEFSKNISRLIPQVVSLEGKHTGNIIFHHRKHEENEIYYFLNNHSSDKAGFTAKIKTFDGYFQKWDPIKNEKFIYPARYENDYSYLNIYLSAGESILLIHLRDNKENLPVIEKSPEESVNNIIIDGDWNITKSDLNMLTLDYCQYKIDGNGYSKILPVLDVHNQSKSFGGKKINLKFEFEIETYLNLITEIYLILEYKDQIKVNLNGHDISFKIENWWLDISFKKTSIKEFIRQGVNIIEIETNLDEFTELESIYLLGDFCLKNYDNRLFSIIRRESTMQTGDLVKQGYPFFCGRMTISKNFYITGVDFKKCFLRLRKLDSMIMHVNINDEDAGFFAWNPLELDITKFIKKGNNKISLEIVSSCRNLLGPHHYKGNDKGFTTPEHFFDEKNWSNLYSFVPFGISVAPEVFLINYAIT